jgi:transposase
METAAKPEMAIDKGMAGPGLLAYIVTSKFSDYLVDPEKVMIQIVSQDIARLIGAGMS